MWGAPADAPRGLELDAELAREANSFKQAGSKTDHLSSDQLTRWGRLSMY